jgi:uncharacterized RDD family membrane protein YckC
MTSIKCPQCGLVNWADAAACKRCNGLLDQSDGFANYNQPYQRYDDMSGPSYSSYVSYETNGDMELADRASRLFAYLIDCFSFFPLILIVFFVAIAGASAGNRGISAGAIILMVLSILVIAVIQLYLLCAYGQTIGKKALRIRIVKQDTGENGGFVTNVLLRGIVAGLIGGIPFIGPVYQIVDILFIFREDKRCIHDLIASTRVVKC